MPPLLAIPVIGPWNAPTPLVLAANHGIENTYAEFEDFNGTDGSNYTNTSGISDAGGTSGGTITYLNAYTAGGPGYKGALFSSTTGPIDRRYFVNGGVGTPKLCGSITFQVDALPTAANVTLIQFLSMTGTISAEFRFNAASGGIVMRDNFILTGTNGTTVLTTGTDYTLVAWAGMAGEGPGSLGWRLYNAAGVLVEERLNGSWTGVNGNLKEFQYGLPNAPGNVVNMKISRPGYSTARWIDPPVSSGITSFTKDSVLLWNVNGSFTKDSTLLWNVNAAFTKDSILLWNVNGSFTKDSILLWNVNSSFTKDSILLWNVLGLTSFTKDITLVWNQNAAFFKDSTLLWNVNGFFTKDSTLLWNVNSAFTKDSILLWNVNSAFTKDSILLWNVNGSFTKDSTLLWNVNSSFTKDSTLLWNVLQTISFTKDITLLWDVLSTVILTNFTKDVALLWRILDIWNEYVDAPETWTERIDSAEIWTPASASAGIWTPVTDTPETWTERVDSAETWTESVDLPETWIPASASAGIWTERVDTPETYTERVDAPETWTPVVDTPETYTPTGLPTTTWTEQ